MIAATVAAQTQAHLRSRHLTDTRIQVIAIEARHSRFAALQQYMASFMSAEPGIFTALEGELRDHIDRIVQLAAGAPTLYFLDPFGIQGLDASTYRKALAGSHNEMFLLFDDIGATRHHGVVSAERGDASEQIRQLRAQGVLFDDFVADQDAQAQAILDRHAARERALDLTSPACAEYLTRALGGEAWRERLAATAPDDIGNEFVAMFLEVLYAAGGSQLLTVPMRRESGQHVYTLVHASKSLSAFAAMKEAVSTALRSGTLPETVCDEIRRDLSYSVGLAVQTLEVNFSGQAVRWTLPKNVRGESIRRFLQRHTPLFDFQFDDVKLAFIEAGYVELSQRGKPKTPIVVRFPAVDRG